MLQDSKASGPIEVTSSGIVTLPERAEKENASDPIVFSVEGNSKDFSAVHLVNAAPPMFSKPSPKKLMVVNAVQHSNAKVPMVLTVLGMLTSFNEVLR